MASSPVKYPSSSNAIGLRGIVPTMSIADMAGAPMSAPELIRTFERFGWDETFMRTARLAALLANGHGHELRKVTHESLTTLARDGNPNLRRVAEYVAANPLRPIANESALYFVEAMALLYGSEGGQAPSDSALAQFLLAANDYCTDWRLPDSASLTRSVPPNGCVHSIVSPHTSTSSH